MLNNFIFSAFFAYSASILLTALAYLKSVLVAMHMVRIRQSFMKAVSLAKLSLINALIAKFLQQFLIFNFISHELLTSVSSNHIYIQVTYDIRNTLT